jgi:predicted DsbA family dithiol-disulfide isomerase
LIQVCEESGLERNRVEHLLRSNEGVAEVLAQEREIKALGTTSVPLFIIQDRVALSGAQPPEAILQAFEQTQKQYPELWPNI